MAKLHRRESRKTHIDLPAWAAPLREDHHRYKVLYGGRGAGRSWSIARALLLMAMERRLRVLCAREIQASIRASVHTLLSEQVELLGFAPFFKITDTEIRCPRMRSVFFFEGLHRNVHKLKSYEAVDIAWIEEAEAVTEESWKVLVPTIRKDRSEIWINFNPDLETDPTYQRFVLRPPPNTWKLHVTASDNPWLPDVLAQERDYAYQTDPDSAAHVWGGECRSQTEAAVLGGKWRIEDFEAGEDWDGPYLGADFGFAAHPTTLVQCWIHEHRLYVERESYELKLGLHKTPAVWRRDVPGAEGYVIRGDSSRPESINYLKENGMPKMAGAPKWKGSVEDGIEHLRSYEAIILHPRCRHAADECRHYRYKTNVAGDILREPNPVHDHIIDAIRYALDPLIRRNRRVARSFSAAAG